MYISHQTLLKLIDDGTIRIEPFNKECIGTDSIDLRLGNHFKRIKKGQTITLDEPAEYEEFKVNGYVEIEPYEMLLGTTIETIHLPDHISCDITGRSSFGRLGLFAENAGHAEAGFKGEITLEIFNASGCKARLETGRRICQAIFTYLDEPSEQPYDGKYSEQTGATESRIYKDLEAGDLGHNLEDIKKVSEEKRRLEQKVVEGRRLVKQGKEIVEDSLEKIQAIREHFSQSGQAQ